MKFSTYAMNASRRNLWRDATLEINRNKHLVHDVEWNDLNLAAGDLGYERESQYELDKLKAKELMACCDDDREAKIIRMRLGLRESDDGQYPKPKTLKQVGIEIGISKERVRQLETRGLKRIQVAQKQKQEM